MTQPTDQQPEPKDSDLALEAFKKVYEELPPHLLDTLLTEVILPFFAIWQIRAYRETVNQ